LTPSLQKKGAREEDANGNLCVRAYYEMKKSGVLDELTNFFLEDCEPVRALLCVTIARVVVR